MFFSSGEPVNIWTALSKAVPIKRQKHYFKEEMDEKQEVIKEEADCFSVTTSCDPNPLFKN